MGGGGRGGAAFCGAVLIDSRVGTGQSPLAAHLCFRATCYLDQSKLGHRLSRPVQGFLAKCTPQGS